jgi:hypothetical protein
MLPFAAYVSCGCTSSRAVGRTPSLSFFKTKSTRWGSGFEFKPVTSSPPTRFELTRCNNGDLVSDDAPASWLALVSPDPIEVWHDRASQMRMLRAHGETLAAIGERFGLSAERVRQILWNSDAQGVDQRPADDVLP